MEHHQCIACAVVPLRPLIQKLHANIGGGCWPRLTGYFDGLDLI